MRRIIMVAARDLRENLTTRGFWIGLLMMPVMFGLIGIVPTWLARQQSGVNFVVLDRAGGYVDVIDQGMARGYARIVMAQLQTYLDRYVADARAAGDTIKLFDRRSELDPGSAQISEADIDAFIAKGGVKSALAAAKPYLVEDAPAFVPASVRFTRLALPADIADAAAPDDFIERIRPYLTGAKTLAGLPEKTALSAAIYIPADFGKSESATDPSGADQHTVMMWANESSRDSLGQAVGGILSDTLRARAYGSAGVSPARVAAIEDMKVGVTQYRIRNRAGEQGRNQQVGMADLVRQFAPAVLCFLLFQASIFTVSLLLTNTIEEKSNKVIEILVSSMSPHELMIGKLLGCAAIGAMIITVWVLFAAIMLAFSSGPVREAAGYAYTVLTSSYLLPAFLIYFVMAYLMLSAIFLIIGSLCNTVREAQNLLGPIMILMVVPMLTIFIIPRDPNGTIAQVLSWVPIFTPIVMLARISASPPLWQVIGTGVLMVATAALLLWGAGAIFKRAILRSGAPIRLREIFALVSSDL
jgi:ABC-2 type transport system permease protein